MKIKVVNGSDSNIEIYKPETEIDVNKRIEKYGPITARELARFFWFNPAKLDYTRLTPIYFKNEIYYGELPDVPENTSIIVKKNDPVSLYLGKYVRNDNYNTRFIWHGVEESMFYMEEREPGIWIDNLDFESGKTSEFLDTLQKDSEIMGMDSIIINNSSPELLKIAASHGYRVAENVIYKGNFEVVNMTMEDLLSMAVNLNSSRKTAMNYNELTKIFFGFRTDMEAYYSGIRNVELGNYYSSMLIYNFDGPFNTPAYGTKNVIALYKAIKKRQFTDEEETVYKYLISRSVTENELIKSLKMNSFKIKETIKSLYSINAIAKDKSRKYITINDEYTKIEAIEILLKELIKRIGFFDITIYRNIAGIYTDVEYNLVVSKLLHENIIKEVLLPGENIILYMGSDLPRNQVRHKFSRIISPKDIISLVFAGVIKSKYHTVNSYLFFMDDAIKLSFAVKKSGKYLTIKNVIGDLNYRDLAKTEFNNAGYILSN